MTNRTTALWIGLAALSGGCGDEGGGGGGGGESTPHACVYESKTDLMCVYSNSLGDWTENCIDDTTYCNFENETDCFDDCCSDTFYQNARVYEMTCADYWAGGTDADTDADTDGDWTCSIDYYGTGDGCDCGCGAVDPDCGYGVGCTAPDCCGVGYCQGCDYCWPTAGECT